MAELNSTIITGNLRVTDSIQSANQVRTDSGVKKDGSTHIYSSYVTFGPTMTVALGASGATANAYGDSSNQSPGYAGTFKVPYIRVNAQGIVTDISEHTVTMPSQQSFTDHNQTVKGNGTAFGADAAIDIVGSNGITVTAGTNQITISGSGSTPTIPTPTSSDNGKVLAVNSSGNYVLTTLTSLAEVYTGTVNT